jgi:hypothetical protein
LSQRSTRVADSHGAADVALHQGAVLILDEFVGLIDDDQLVLDHEAEGAALIEHRGEGGLPASRSAIEAERLHLAVLGGEEFFELAGELGLEKRLLADERNDEVIGGKRGGDEAGFLATGRG